MTPLVSSLMALAVWLVHPSEHAYLGETEDETLGRYEAYATTVASVVLDPDEDPLLGLDRERTGAVVIVVTARESMFRRDVMSCERRGLGGAFGPLQYQGPRALVCDSWRQAIRWGLAMMRESFARCSSLPLLDRLSIYTDGACHANWPRSRVRVAPALRWPLSEASS